MALTQVIGHKEQCSVMARQVHVEDSHKRHLCLHSNGSRMDHLSKKSNNRWPDMDISLQPKLSALTFVVSHTITGVVIGKEVDLQHLAEKLAPRVNATQIFRIRVRIQNRYTLFWR